MVERISRPQLAGGAGFSYGKRTNGPQPAIADFRGRPCPRDREDRIDAFERIKLEFVARPSKAMKETLLEAAYSAYRARSFGSSVGLEAELETLERQADAMIEAELRREGGGR